MVFGLLSFHVLGANRKMNHDSGALATVFYCFLAHNLYFCCTFCACGCLFGLCTSFPYCLESAWAVGFSHFLSCIMIVLAVRFVVKAACFVSL